MRISLLIVFTLFSSSSVVSLFAQCEEMRKSVQYEDFGEPILTGPPALFPEIKLKITRNDTGEIMPLQEVRLFYKWRHFVVSPKYNTDGKWTETADLIRCITSAEGIVNFPEYNFVPRAWYDGPKIQSILRGKNVPRFHELELSVENWHYLITKDQIKKIRDGKIKESIELKNYDKSKYPRPVKVEIIP